MVDYLLLIHKVVHLNSNNQLKMYVQFWTAFKVPYIPDFHRKYTLVMRF
jgi:hypothetical protein